MAGSDQEATPRSQSERFIDKARELGCDESEDSFDQKLRRVAKTAAPKKAAKKPPKK
ncbi:MAG: hypothetical protein ACPW61_09090 [Methyloligella sp. ZOD6]